MPFPQLGLSHRKVLVLGEMSILSPGESYDGGVSWLHAIRFQKVIVRAAHSPSSERSPKLCDHCKSHPRYSHYYYWSCHLLRNLGQVYSP